jgi:hypothetical protein
MFAIDLVSNFLKQIVSKGSKVRDKTFFTSNRVDIARKIRAVLIETGIAREWTVEAVITPAFIQDDVLELYQDLNSTSVEAYEMSGYSGIMLFQEP